MMEEIMGFGLCDPKIASGKIKIIEEILEERGKEYGEFLTQAEISQDLKSYIKPRGKFKDIEREALEMICHKMARIINGNPHNIDSWKDIAGYAMLVVKELEKENGEKS